MHRSSGIASLDLRMFVALGLALISLSWIADDAAAEESTMIYIVRHAETTGEGADPSLSEVGQARAQELTSVLQQVQIDAVFVTHLARTQETGAPVAENFGLTSIVHAAGDTQFVVDTILADHRGDNVLVVAHSNTVDDIATGLGAVGVRDLGHDQFDQLLMIMRSDEEVQLERIFYGVRTP